MSAPAFSLTTRLRPIRPLRCPSRYPNYMATVEGVEVHFLHAKSSRAGAIPLLLPHGWPSSFYEWHKMVDRLTSPASADDPAFDVVVVSQVGWFLSGKPPKRDWTMRDNARLYHKIMTELLGYKSYAAHGGDWVRICMVLISRKDMPQISNASPFPQSRVR